MELSTADYYRQLKTKEVATLLGISNTTVWVWVKEGIIPEPRYTTPRHPRWKLGEVIESHERYRDEVNIQPSGFTGVKGVQKVATVKDAVKKVKARLEPKDSIAKKLKDRFKIGT